MRFSIIVPAYKEKAINRVLTMLLNQNISKNLKLDRIFVIACGYKNFSFLKNKKIHIVKESRRNGKAYAMNLALQIIKSTSKSDVIVVHNADVFPKRNMLKNLLEPFKNPEVGMSCVRPISLDSPKKFVGFLNNLVWELHHIVSLEAPKVGEVFAFRNMIKKIPKKLAADEAYVEYVIRRNKNKIIYRPNAVVFNRGPKNISEFITQRRRFFTGHIHVKNKYHYKVSTMNIVRIIKSTYKYIKKEPPEPPKKLFWILCAIFLEAYARLLGTIDFYVFKKVPYTWKVVKSSRNYIVGYL